MQTILECQGVSKAYGGLIAVKNVSFDVGAGEIFAIVGPNGAGKTTLFDTVSGLAPATAGSIRFDAHEIQRLSPDRICRLGLTRTFQTTVSFDTQTVLTNVLLGSVFGQPGGGQPTLRFGGEVIAHALDALEFCNLLDKQHLLPPQLSVFERKRLMFATALATKPRLLLLDEPVGGLNRTERDELVELVRKINGSGITVLMIEHVMKAVQALASRMIVLHHGEKIAEGPPAVVLRDQQVIDVYLGKQGRELSMPGTRNQEPGTRG
jgi:ABC-type branched-subunit amino acid transport system ATPase component